MHLCTRAKQTKDPIVEVGNSIHEFLKDIGISTGGGPRGGYTTFKRQMMALAACDVQIGFTDEHQRDHTINTHPVYEFQAWLQGDGKQIDDILVVGIKI